MSQTLSTLSLLIILAIWGALPGCTTSGSAALKAPSSRQSFLWEAKKGDQQLTLVGTMHVGISRDDMDPKLWSRLADAETVIVETDVGNQDPALMQSFMLLPKGQDLSKLLGPKHWKRFVEVLKKGDSAFTEDGLKQYTPMAAGALLLQLQAKEEQDMAPGQVPIDQVIYEKAKELKKKTLTFETNKEQLGHLKTVFTIEAVRGMLDDWDAESKEFARLKDTFKRGDSKALDALLEEVPAEIRGVLLDARNRNWMQALPKLSSKRHTLIAVGAAHFAGAKGLLKLLEQNGYSIKPL